MWFSCGKQLQPWTCSQWDRLKQQQGPQQRQEGEVVETECEAVAVAAVAAAVEATELGLGPELEIELGPSVEPVGLAEIEPKHLVDLASAAAWLEHTFS